MNTETVRIFADNYTSTDFDKIKYDGNGKSGSKFHDNNGEFRTEVLDYVIPNINIVKLELVRDLYLALGKSSEDTLSVYTHFNLLAQELLERGGTDYLFFYLEGAANTIDTAGHSSRIVLSKDRAKELLAYFDAKKLSTTNKEESKLLVDYFRRRFVRYAAN